MKKFFLQMTSILVIICLIAGCSPKEGGEKPKEQNEQQESVETEVSVPEVQRKVEDFLEIKTVDGVFATLQVPKFKTDAVSSDDITMANEMFAYIEEVVMASVEKCKENAEAANIDVKQLFASTLYDTKAALNGNILSVLIKYGEMAFFSEQMYYYTAVNVDITTGKVVTYEKLLEASGFSKEDAEKSLFWYGKENKTYEWEQRTYYTFASEEKLPTGLGDPSGGWQDELESVVEEFRNPPKPQDSRWKDLDIFPTAFYEGKGNMSVCGRFPVDSGFGYEYAMVSVGKTAGELAHKNLTNWYGKPFAKHALLADEASIAFSRALKLDENGKTPEGVKLDIELCFMKNITSDEGENEPRYVFAVYEDRGTHTATRSWMAVGVISGYVLENVMETDQWNRVPMDVGVDEKKIVEDAKTVKASAAVYNEPDDYELWRVTPYGMFNFPNSETADEEAEISKSAKGFLIFVTEDSEVSLEEGTFDDGKFSSKKVLEKENIPEGQCVYVRASQLKEKNEIAIVVRNKSGESTYEIFGKEAKEKTEYLTN